ncbi:MAG TPA: TadE/TadG family type IV pilus assembly protein [Caulobacteraceae bacterium]|nr:TadE/TadG family type IV pilus assembly protein [Caulobacteraceae bacterium]
MAVLRMLNRFWRANAGVAAIEFAFIGPVLITLYFGVAELTQAMLAQRRLAHAASTMGDLVAQGTTIQASNFTDLWVVGQTIISPFPTSPLKMRITSIVANAQGATTVAWSEASGMTPYGKNASITVDSGVVAASQSVIMSEISYTYTSPISYIIHTPITFTNKYYLRPRLSDTVACSDC